MLERMQGHARRWRALRPLLLALAMLSLAAGLGVLLTSNNQAGDAYLIPTIVLFLWCLMLHAFLSLFAHVPPPAVMTLPWRPRMMARCKRGFYTLFLWTFAALTALLLITSWQLAGAWRMMY